MVSEGTRTRRLLRISERVMEITASASYCLGRLEAIKAETLAIQAELRALEGLSVMRGGIRDDEPQQAA